MRRYANSWQRIAILGLMLSTVVLVTFSYGQATPAAPAPAAPAVKQGIANMIFSHIDFVFITIALLSVAGLTLIIQGFIQNRSSVLMPTATVESMREMISRRQFKELMDFTEADPSFVSRALNPALKRAPSFNAMKEAMESSIGEQTAEQFRKIEYLNIIGNLGPLLGLLGTVLGMIKAFQEVASKKGQADVTALSDGISIALTHTFLGLMLAVPCLAAFGVLRTIVDRLTVRGALVAEELLLMVKPQEARAASTPAPAPPVARVAPIMPPLSPSPLTSPPRRAPIE